MKIYIKIENLMKEHDLSIRKMSEKTGVNRLTLTKYKNGPLDNVNVEVIEKICSTFDCRVEDLIEIK
ncbi:helix-turn-helix transcriptional regulator [Salipaludibacillus agaradhaerens]|uniref:Helix-turn-helix transcriptional regulator n=1 Tax=Salipaludibacillus agaradhaerens TaxID=76935 RepID=A0A9Q4B206_SALAG|nr:helix-turn-helix transcriptional regulator [Salipaludibacillus agaradhaerens]MCR6096898.1 helix-turn-helix transcriptional regulator [Salipaludibacillus agaradhaerens]MCR6116668.1 helix-turn-helix transcriptional regulator [Salipaludibacillus agaradhaerens]